MLHADGAARAVVQMLLTELDHVESDRRKDLERYQKRCSELESDKWYWEKKYFELLYPE